MLKGKVAVITGGTRGIGFATAKKFLENEAKVVLLGSKQETVEKALKELKHINSNYDVIGFYPNLSSKEEMNEIFKKIKEIYGRIDILINNAGFGDAGNFTETSLDKEMDMIDLNIKAYHILTKLFLKDFTKRNYGRILNVASMAGLMPGPYMATYYATKNYIVSLSLAIYEELRKDNSNVKISIFCPGPVDTNFNNVADVKFNISSLTSDYASKIAIDGMFKNKLIIVPPNMKLNRFLIKIVPSKIILDINSQIQEKRKSKEEN